MSIYLLKQQTILGGAPRVAAVMAGNETDAEFIAKQRYGDDWTIMKAHPTLEDVESIVEDSPTEALLLNL